VQARRTTSSGRPRRDYHLLGHSCLLLILRLRDWTGQLCPKVCDHGQDKGMSSPSALLTAARDAALAAIESSDWNEVYRQCLKASAIISTIPDSEVGGNMSSMVWDRKGIQNLMAEAKRNMSDPGMSADPDNCGFHFCQVEYTGTRGTSCGGCG